LRSGIQRNCNRYDFQGTGSKLAFDRDEKKIDIESNSELKLEAIEGVLESKFIKAGLSLKFLDKVEKCMKITWFPVKQLS
jgi:uncharacterized protein YajQ (UPF0234 family)